MRSAYSTLDVVAVLGQPDPRLPWRRLTPIFRRRDDGTILFPIRSDHEYLIGIESSRDALDLSCSAGAATLLPRPLPAYSNHVPLSAADGSVQYLPIFEADRRERNELRQRIGTAFEAVLSGDTAQIQEAFDAAYLVSPRNTVVATLRAGAAASPSGNQEWAVECVEDLKRLASSSADLSACTASVLWRELPDSARAEDLLRSAREALDVATRPEVVLDPPVPMEDIEMVRVLSLFQRTAPMRAASLPHRLVASARSGDPAAMRSLSDLLEFDTVWKSCKERISEPEIQRSTSEAVAKAQAESLRRYARTLYTLEMSCNEPDRRSRWLLFRSRVSGINTQREPVPWRAGELLADEARTRLHVSTGHLDDIRNWMEEAAGTYVAGASFENEFESACTAPENVPPCLFVRFDSRVEAVEKARFSIAHELAHLLIDRQFTSHWVCREATVDSERSDSEKRANAFAAYYLAPIAEVRALVAERPAIGTPDFYNSSMRVATHFGMSSVTAGEHLLNCFAQESRAKLSQEVRGRLRDLANEQPCTSFGEHAEWMYRGRYRSLLRRLVSAGNISLSQAKALLGVRREEMFDLNE